MIPTVFLTFHRAVSAWFAVAIAMASLAADAPTIPYPRLPGMPIVTDHRLTQADRDIPIYTHPAGCFSILRITAPVGLTMERPGKPIQAAVLRPSACVTAPRIEAGRVHFQVPGPGTYALELDGDQIHPFFLFVKPPEPVPDPGSVTYFFGPGQVHELPGGTLTLASGQSVHIAGGAVVKGSIQVGAPKDVEGHRQGLTKPAQAATRDVRITGQGVLAPGDKGMPLAIFHGDGIHLEGLTVLNTQQWTVRLFNVARSTVSGLHVFSTGKYSDGIDLMGCTDVQVRDSFFRSEDDCVAIKGRKFDVIGGNVERITLDNLVIWHGSAGNGIEIGWELGVDHIKDITIRHCRIMHSDCKTTPFKRAALSIHNSGGAAVSGILYEDIDIEQAREGLVHLWVGNSSFSKGATRIGSIADVTFRRLRHLDGPAVPITIDSSQSAGSIRNVIFEDCRILGKRVAAIDDLGLKLLDAATPLIR